MKRATPVGIVLGFAMLGFLAAGSGSNVDIARAAAPPSRSPSPSPSPSPSRQPKPPVMAPSDHDFGTSCSGKTTAPYLFQLTNKDTDTLQIGDITAVGPFIAGPPGIASLDGGASTTIPVRFRPTGSGPADGTVTVATDHGSVSVTVSGNAIDKQLSIAPSALSFGPVRTGTASAARTITIANTGLDRVAIAGMSLSGSGDFSGLGFGAFALAPGASRKVSISFKPSTDGPKFGALTVSSDACVDPVRSVAVSGSGARPKIAVRPATLALTAQPGKPGPPISLTVIDSGNAPLKVKSVRLTGPSAAAFALTGLPGFPAIVSAGDSFSFDVRMRAWTLASPAPDAVIEILSDDATTPVVKVAVKGSFSSPSPTPSASASPTVLASAAPAPPTRRRGGSSLGALKGYVGVFLVLLLVGAAFAALLGLRTWKFRRILRRYTT